MERLFGDTTLCIITGSYGSGKTEVAVNLAMRAKEAGHACTLVDLDVVNPYFRSRDVRDAFRRDGIEVVAPEGHFSHADLPMLSPRIKGAIEDTTGYVILDVGGDPMGARVLARYAAAVLARPGGYRMVLVANTRRPDTRTPGDINAMADMIEGSGHLSVHEIVANSHLMEETTTGIVNEGVVASREAAENRGADFRFACVLDRLADRLDLGSIQAPVFVLRKTMLKPWEGGRYAAYRC